MNEADMAAPEERPWFCPFDLASFTDDQVTQVEKIPDIPEAQMRTNLFNALTRGSTPTVRSSPTITVATHSSVS